MKILEQTTFSQFLSESGEHPRIRIPQLQRDYAQGRKGTKETEIRAGFLTALREALERPVDGKFAPLNLDFVYGSDETTPDAHFSPLDGQQRLTTLFLLHWLLAWRDGGWDDFTARFREGTHPPFHARFSYRVRTSSAEFFDSLVANPPPQPAAALPDLKGWITDQPWYFRYWRLDPTVQGVLEMLQAMHAFFAGRRPGTLYARLVDEEHPAITFQLLDLGEFPLSDDLYIKMNARGKPLTAFETFKARYEPLLPKHFASAPPRKIGDVAFKMAEFVERRLDTAWTDFLWEYHRKLWQERLRQEKPEKPEKFDPQRLDESFMNLFRLVALASRNPDSPTFRADSELLTDHKNPPTFSTFADREWLDAPFSALLVSLLESWCVSPTLLPDDSLFKETAILRKVLDRPADLTVPETFLFCGYALFIQQHEGHLDPVRFNDWMRVVHNLGINSEINGLDRLQPALRSLRSLLPKSLTILPHLASFGAATPLGTFYTLPQHEETLKAALLLADPAGWQELIKQAESHGYFVGQIDFLLDFSGTKAEWEKTWSCGKWDAATHRRLQRSFTHYLQHATAMFDDEGLIESPEKRWQRALLGIGDYLLLYGYTNHSFLVNPRSDPDNWRRLLRGSGDAEEERRPYLKMLWDKLDEIKAEQSAPGAVSSTLEELLDAVIDRATGMEPWREALVKNAVAVEEWRTIQRATWEHPNQVYLLATTQRNGEHAELFTFVLEQQLQRSVARKPLTPLSIGEYQYSNRKENQPYLPLPFPWKGAERSLDIYAQNGLFELWIELPKASELRTLFTGAGFLPNADNPGWLLRTVAPGNVKSALREIAALLSPP